MTGKRVAYSAVFGILIGLWETLAGNFLHQLRVPFTGETLSFFDILIFAYIFQKTRDRNIILYSVAVAIAIRITLMGTFSLGPIIGVAAISLLFYTGTILKKIAYLAGGTLAGLWSPFYFGIIKVKLLGPELLQSYKFLFKKAGITFTPEELIILLIIVGGVSGLLAGIAGQKLGRDLP